jgi:hypothetical protein
MLKTFLLPTISVWGTGLTQRYSAGLRAGWSEVRIPAGARKFSLHHRVQTGSGALSASHPTSTSGSRDKRLGREADHSPLSSTEVKNECSYTSTPQYTFMVRCSVKAQGQLYLLPLLLLIYLLTYLLTSPLRSHWNIGPQLYNCWGFYSG